jgi:SAM-dependent methyltransferase
MIVRQPGDTMVEIEAAFAPLAGRRILDIGCGPGRLIEALSRRAVLASGIDPDPEAVAQAMALLPSADVRQAGAERLPFADASFDGTIFLNSLHHVPVALMLQALLEALRVVGRAGSVVVVEPLPEGPFFEAMRPLEDEIEVRLAAQDALATLLSSGKAELLALREWERVERFATLDDFIARILAADPGRSRHLAVARPALAAGFETLAEREGDRYVLRQPLRLHQLRAAAAGP